MASDGIRANLIKNISKLGEIHNNEVWKLESRNFILTKNSQDRKFFHIVVRSSKTSNGLDKSRKIVVRDIVFEIIGSKIEFFKYQTVLEVSLAPEKICSTSL